MLTPIGPTPWSEDCVQFGTENYETRAKQECERFKRQLQRQFPIPEELQEIVSYAITRSPYEARDGSTQSYLEVSIRHPQNHAEAVAFVVHVEAEAPEYWDQVSKVEIATEANWKRWTTNAPISYDGFGIVEVTNKLSNPDRQVLIDPQHEEWQIQRYASGGYRYQIVEAIGITE